MKHWLLVAFERDSRADLRFGGLGQCRGMFLWRNWRPNMPNKTNASTKAAMVTKILSREKGATILEIAKATGWQPHSCRAFLTGVRKKSPITKEQRPDGKLAYRIEAVASVPAE